MVFHVKQSSAEALGRYKELIERYHGTLDLVSDKALGRLDDLISDGERFGSLLSTLSPATGAVLDVGSGVGLPGVPVALALPSRSVVLVERRRRRVSFLRIVVGQLGLENVTVVASDVRKLVEPRVAVVTAQAVASFAELYRLTRHLHGETVWLVTRKGPGWRDELAAWQRESGVQVLEVREEDLSSHGRLAAVQLTGGKACPQSG